MKKYASAILSLTLICLIVAALLGAANHITAPIIREAEKAKANEALLLVMPHGKNFKEVDISAYKLPQTVTDAFSEDGGGYVIKLVTTGYSSGLTIMCGVDSKGIVTGVTCLSSGETLGYEKTYGENFTWLGINDIDGIDTIGGATKTTQAFKNAVKDALNAATILSGGTADIRTEEEILRDNLLASLPGAESFSMEFIAEELGNVTAVYKADGGKGYVFVLGELFVGVGADGAIVTDVDAQTRTEVISAYEKHVNSFMYEIDLSAYNGISERVEKAYKTASGNYVFDLAAAGYGINGDYGASGEYIRIKVSATASGRIISCVTVYQKETENIGSACASPSYYEQYNGKTAETLGEVDAIAGATTTHRGYSIAVSKIFEAIEILKGAE